LVSGDNLDSLYACRGFGSVVLIRDPSAWRALVRSAVSTLIVSFAPRLKNQNKTIPSESTTTCAFARRLLVLQRRCMTSEAEAVFVQFLYNCASHRVWYTSLFYMVKRMIVQAAPFGSSGWLWKVGGASYDCWFSLTPKDRLLMRFFPRIADEQGLTDRSTAGVEAFLESERNANQRSLSLPKGGLVRLAEWFGWNKTVRGELMQCWTKWCEK
jgi:hypothetical protein